MMNDSSLLTMENHFCLHDSSLLVTASSPHISDQVRKNSILKRTSFQIHMNHQSKKKNKLLETHKLRTNMEWHKKVEEKTTNK